MSNVESFIHLSYLVIIAVILLTIACIVVFKILDKWFKIRYCTECKKEMDKIANKFDRNLKR